MDRGPQKRFRQNLRPGRGLLSFWIFQERQFLHQGPLFEVPLPQNVGGRRFAGNLFALTLLSTKPHYKRSPFGYIQQPSE